MGSEREEVAFPVSPLHLTWEPGYKASACAAAKVLNLPHRALCPDMRGPTLHFGPTTTDMSVASRLGEEGYLLCVEEQAGELVMQCLGRSPRGAFYALRCLRAAWEGEASLSLPLGVTVEEPAFAHRGIAEAAPLGWSWEIRGQLLLFAGRHQFDHYLYAPDDDPYRAARWREPYPPQEAQALSHFLSQARELFVSIIYGLQPELDPTSESDLRTLEEKCHWLVEAGVEGIALLCDAGKASGDIWAQLANRPYSRLACPLPPQRVDRWASWRGRSMRRRSFCGRDRSSSTPAYRWKLSSHSPGMWVAGLGCTTITLTIASPHTSSFSAPTRGGTLRWPTT